MKASAGNNVGGHTLCWAAKLDHPQIGKTLIEHGNNAGAAPGGGYMPLAHACKSGSLEMVKLFLDSGADVNKRCCPPRDAETQLHEACFFS
jgi:ankyrin repeat protein